MAPLIKKHALTVLGVAALLLLAGFVALRLLVVEVMRIPQLGMYPTYGAGARIVVDKWRPSPRRGDVVAFDWPEDPAKRFVQRLIALPGDVLDVRGGHPWVNGWPVPSCDVGPGHVEDASGRTRAGRIVVEFLEGGAYLTFYDAHPSDAPPEHTLTAKPGEYLVLGDNRLSSYDSRGWFHGEGGGVPRALVVGVPFTPPPLDVPADLRPALGACLAKQPAPDRATPPPPPAR